MSFGEPRRIDCPQCGGALELYGGHKVQSVVCQHCGSLLDSGGELELLQAHRELTEDRAWLPLELGMRGRLKGVDYTLIGLVQYRSYPDTWVEFCLYSPTHGYQWLSCEQGHWIFYRRVRILPKPHLWWDLAPRRSVEALGKSFQFYEAYKAEIRDLAGELPWIAHRGDSVRIADAIAPPLMLSVEKTGQELEYALGEYLPTEQVQAAFAEKDRGQGPQADRLARQRPPSGVHPARPYVEGPLLAALRRQSWRFGLVALVVFALIGFLGSGRELLRESFTADQLDAAEPAQGHSFQVSDADQLVEIELVSTLNNAWNWYDLGVLRDGKEIFSLGKEIGYYQGVEGGDSWSEGSRSARLHFRVPEPGQYRLTYQSGGGTGRSGLQAIIREGVLLDRWFLFLSGFFALAAAVPLGSQTIFEHRRWRPVTGD